MSMLTSLYHMFKPDYSRHPVWAMRSVMLGASYADIMWYCQKYENAAIVCNDISFWLDKIDYERTTKDPNGKLLIPSDYIKAYSDPPYELRNGKDIYRKWLNVDRNTQSVNNGIDVLIFDIDATNMIYGYDPRTTIIEMVRLKYNDKLIEIFNRKLLLVPAYDSYNPEISIDNIIPYAYQYDNIDLLKYFDEKIDFTSYFEPSYLQNKVNKAVLNGYIDILDWSETLGILPNNINYDVLQTLKDKANEDIRYVYTVQWLFERDLIPERLNANIIEWLSERLPQILPDEQLPPYQSNSELPPPYQ